MDVVEKWERGALDSEVRPAQKCAALWSSIVIVDDLTRWETRSLPERLAGGRGVEPGLLPYEHYKVLHHVRPVAI